MPFTGLHVRAGELIAHHAERCALIGQACRLTPQSAADLLPVLFERALDPQQMSFAFHEVVAHINDMCARGALIQTRSDGGIWRSRAV